MFDFIIYFFCCLIYLSWFFKSLSWSMSLYCFCAYLDSMIQRSYFPFYLNIVHLGSDEGKLLFFSKVGLRRVSLRSQAIRARTDLSALSLGLNWTGFVTLLSCLLGSSCRRTESGSVPSGEKCLICCICHRRGGVHWQNRGVFWLFLM